MKKLEQLEAIYRQLPSVNCKGLCTESCSIIALFPIEVRNIRQQHSVPEAIALHIGRIQCSALKAGKCTIYEQRPLVCRLFGLIPAMRCPYGCQPERWLNEDEVQAIKDQIATLESGSISTTLGVSLDHAAEALRQAGML